MKPEVGVFQVFCTSSLQEEGRQKRLDSSEAARCRDVLHCDGSSPFQALNSHEIHIQMLRGHLDN